MGRGIFEGVEEGGTPWVFAYFQGVLDWAAMIEAEGETVTGFNEPTLLISHGDEPAPSPLRSIERNFPQLRVIIK